MQPVRPKVDVPNDPQGLMASLGWIVGYGKGVVVWQFGFLPGTVQALAYNLSVEKQKWVIAATDGTILLEAQGKNVSDLPQPFKKVLRTGIWHRIK